MKNRTVHYKQWGSDIEPEAIEQMDRACSLPVSVAGALMADAHSGYGLPIGGVLAVRDAVIPYAVGVDIACRMKMTVLDITVDMLQTHSKRLKNALCSETLFGVGVSFKNKRQHPVMDEDWGFSSFIRKLKDKAWSQLGTSGSGNHFVEFGILDIPKADLGLEAGQYLALLSHSGSRGVGNDIAKYYSNVALKSHPELSAQLSHLAWLDMDSSAGQEYWKSMQLMGLYASANHELIHSAILNNLNANKLADIENYHNFAWEEMHEGRKVIVHRKGATPAAVGNIGIIPGSMATPGYVVRGKGNALSINSASHGAGRKMSRRKAKKLFNWHDAKKFLEDRGVELISAGLDEVPMAYKDIDEVMKAQHDLVEPIARFDPKIVRMSSS
ncbi:MAG: RtcB family protein [Sedimentisphaeraceae bacterium JB056]